MGQNGVREDCLCLIEQQALVVIACAEMSKDEPFHPCVPCHLRRLCCRAVIIDTRTLY